MPFEYRWFRFRNEKEDAHGMVFRQRWFPSGKFNRSDSEGPYVCFKVIARLTYNLGRHPKLGISYCVMCRRNYRRPHESVATRLVCDELCRNAEIGFEIS